MLCVVGFVGTDMDIDENEELHLERYWENNEEEPVQENRSNGGGSKVLFVKDSDYLRHPMQAFVEYCGSLNPMGVLQDVN